MKFKKAHNPLDDFSRKPQWIVDYFSRCKAFRGLSNAEQQTIVTSRSRIIDYWVNEIDKEVTSGELLGAIYFPAFVSDFDQGIFEAVLNTLIEQMKDSRDLLKSIAQSVEQFMRDNATDNQAIECFITLFPNLFALAKNNDLIVEKQREATEERCGLVVTLMGLPTTELDSWLYY